MARGTQHQGKSPSLHQEIGHNASLQPSGFELITARTSRVLGRVALGVGGTGVALEAVGKIYENDTATNTATGLFIGGVVLGAAAVGTRIAKRAAVWQEGGRTYTRSGILRRRGGTNPNPAQDARLRTAGVKSRTAAVANSTNTGQAVDRRTALGDVVDITADGKPITQAGADLKQVVSRVRDRYSGDPTGGWGNMPPPTLDKGDLAHRQAAQYARQRAAAEAAQLANNVELATIMGALGTNVTQGPQPPAAGTGQTRP